jgi:putative radical SAM enzyme (TIGR03279 family)
MSQRGGKVASVAEWGAAAAAGVLPKDRLVGLDGDPVRDVLDVAWYESDGVRSIDVVRKGRVLEFESDGGPLGLTFEESVFDGVRRCRNRCTFCFVDQLPKGLRRSLYVKDDDYRLSLMYGNFVTLTNLDESDVARILEQRISPLYLSWHATDREVRRRLIGPRAQLAVGAVERLVAGGIEFHVQIVLCPGANDGDVLEGTLDDLWSKGPAVRSVGVVPVGRSALGEVARGPAPPGAAYASDLLRRVRSRQRRALAERGTRWVWAADEWYLKAGMTLPGITHYEDLAQLGNGVGIATAFLAEVRDAARRSGQGKRPARSGRASGTRRSILLTGELSAPVLGEAAMILEERLGLDVEVLPVANRLFGGEVTVTGLLGGAEILDAVRKAARRGRVLVPDVVFEPGGQTLDGVARADVERAVPGSVEVVPSNGRGLVRRLREEAVAA